MEIRRIHISELDSFVSDAGYASWEVIPISRHRAKSYINNPRANPSDVVLYLAYIENKLVGYRTVLPDTVLVNGTVIKVGWLSGNWVSPSFRRKGVASELFRNAYKDWQGNLLFTNYALESKAVYDKTGHFSLVNRLYGLRLYIRPCLNNLLSSKGTFFKNLSPLWRIADWVLSLLNPIPILSRCYSLKGFGFEYIQFPDKETESLFSNITTHTPSQRGASELEWILTHPWLVSSPLGDRLGERYYFSSSPKHFQQVLVKVYKYDEFIGFFLANQNGKAFSAPYLACKEEHSAIFAKALLKHAVRMGANYLTIFNQPLAKQLKGMSPLGWISKNQYRNFFATNELASKLSQNQLSFLEGDGDCAFV